MQDGKPHQRARDLLAEIGTRIPRGLGFGPDRANDADPAQRVGGDQAATPQPTRRIPTRSPTNTGPADRRMQEAERAAGFKAGGQVGKRPPARADEQVEPVSPGEVDLIEGPGTATSDSIPARMERGTHILPASTTEDVLLSNGEAAVSPEVVQQVGQAALDALRSATRGASGFKPIPGGTPGPVPGFATGGVIGEDEQRRLSSFGDAAAARMSSGVAQIPTTGYPTAPDGNRVDSTELGRNVSNTLVALPGAAPALGAARTLAAARGFDTAASGVRGGVSAALPYGTPAAGAVGLANASSSNQLAPAQPAAAAAPAAVRAPAAGAPGALGSAAQAAPAGFTPQAQQPGGSNVTRVGNSYSATGPVSGDITINGRAPGGGVVSAQNMGAADALASRSAAESLARVSAQAPGNSAAAPRPFTATGGSFGFRRDPRIEQAARIDNANYNRASGADVQSRRLAAQEAEVGVQRDRNAIAAQDSYARNVLGAARLGFEGRAADAETGGRMRRAAAEQAYLEARTPEERAAALATLQALSGATPAPRFTVVPGGTDEMGNRQASSVLNNQTGQFVPQGGGQAGASQRPVGTTSTVNGRTAVWDGSKWVPR